LICCGLQNTVDSLDPKQSTAGYTFLRAVYTNQVFCISLDRRVSEFTTPEVVS